MWDKIIVESDSREGIENIAAVLVNNGIAGMEIIDSAERLSDLSSIVGSWDYADEHLLIDDNKMCVVFYLAKADGNDKVLGKIESELRMYCGVTILREKTDESKWSNEWKKHFKPIKIGNVVIVPKWEAYKASSDETVFMLDPGAAFGTGQHESTRLCVQALQEFVKASDVVLDIGCGSGILACISSLLGAKKVVACDTDPCGAISATKQNAVLNGITNIQVLAGEATRDLAEQLREEKYDVVAANIVADVVIELTPFAKSVLKPGGKFVCSGIIGERAKDVREKLKEAGFGILKESELSDWFLFVGCKNA